MKVKDLLEIRKTEKIGEGVTPYIEIGDIDIDSKQYELKEKASVAGAVTAYEGEILVSTVRPTRGAITVVKEKQCAVSSAFAVLKVNSSICEAEYLFFLLNSKPFMEYLGKNSKGATYPTCSKEDVLSYQVKPVALSEQWKIIDELETISKVLALRKKELNLLDDLIKARFVEMFGDARENPNGYATVPFVDLVEYMGDIGSNGSNKVVVDHLDMKDEEDYAMMVRFTNFTKNDFTDDVKYVSKEAYDFFKKSQIFGGELIICKIGSAGQNYVMPCLNRPVSLGLNQIMVRIKENILMPYLYQYLHTDYGEFLISGCINGAVTKTITKTELKKIPIMLPPLELQNEFAEFVNHIDELKVKVQQSLDEIQILLDSLMQKYFG